MFLVIISDFVLYDLPNAMLNCQALSSS